MSQSLHSIKLIEALQFSAIKHTKQRRKDIAATPYINHPIEVLHILAVEGSERNEEILMGAILHDTIEDTATTNAELVTKFGVQVASYVTEVTDDKGLSWVERKRMQIAHAVHLSEGGGQIKRADKITNMRDIARDPPASWGWRRQVNYFRWADAVVKAIPHPSSLDTVFDATYEAGLRQIITRALNQVNELGMLDGLAGLPESVQVIQVLDRLDGTPVWELA